jgi:hypothetical protein
MPALVMRSPSVDTRRARELGAGVFSGGVGGHVGLEARNLGWLQAQINNGGAIYDIGLEAGRSSRSIFYSEEVKLLINNGYVRKFVKFVMVDGEVYELAQWVSKK